MIKPVPLKEVTLYRDLYATNATTGFLKRPDGTNICRTLELAWNNNLRDDKKTKIKEASCIPEGRYRCTRFFSSNLRVEVILINDVPKRSLCQIHFGNITDEIEGCILVGDKIEKNIEYKGKINEFFITNSLTNLKKLKNETDFEFFLTVTSANTLCNPNSTKGHILTQTK